MARWPVREVFFQELDPGAGLFPRSRFEMTPVWFGHGAGVRGRGRYSRFLGPRCRSVAAGRYAIGLAMKGAGVGPGDRVLLPAYHCGSMVEPALWLGAEVDFYHLRGDLQVDLGDLTARLKKGAKAVLATRYFGFPEGLSGVRPLCDEHGAVLIEDCAHSLAGDGSDDPPGWVGHFAVGSTWKFCPGPDGGVVCSNAGPVNWPAMARPGLGRQARALYRVVERAVRHVCRGSGDPGGETPDVMRVEGVETPPMARDSGESQAGVGRSLRWFDAADARVDMTWVAKAAFRLVDFRRMAAVRRENYRLLLERCSALGRARPLYGDLAEGVVPYAFPVLLHHPAEDFRRLKYRGMPIWRWDELAASDCAVSQSYRHSLLQLPCHEDLRPADREWMAETLAAVLA